MKSISIKELHERTGHWVRLASEEGEVIVTERGRPIARVLPPEVRERRNPFLGRRLLPGVGKLIARPLGGPTSTETISEGRDGR